MRIELPVVWITFPSVTMVEGVSMLAGLLAFILPGGLELMLCCIELGAVIE